MTLDPKTALVMGMLLVVLALPALISAWADRRKPFAGTILLFAGCALGTWAWRRQEGGFRLDEVPDILYGVIGQMIG
ncbi:MAG: hypothetical protein ACU0CC_23225 [Sagittula sp.]|jgi:Na+/melibiose symporter-like transporter|uniref:hypothetical protein n=1 Tax=unclassified Sagittula TaxID=2624628 RepID=UPI000C2D29BD|nr:MULTISPECIES: hypothetical protein [unclassified Sagittula]AUC54068.1 hypothetical protein CDO87_13150 [Sagittula sp. P11]WHZ34571.1 hypothetical protein QNI11_18285 [Sagittula sp. MA-2]